MAKLNNKKRTINKHVQINHCTGVKKGFIIRCAHLSKRNTAFVKRYSKARHLKALRRAEKSNKPLSLKLPQSFAVTAEDLK